jgi:hypothetical protein
MAPRDNDFLKNTQATNFVKESNEQLKKSLSSVFNNTTRAFMSSTDVQMKNIESLKVLNSSITMLNKKLVGDAKSPIIEQTKTLNRQNMSFFKTLSTDLVKKISSNITPKTNRDYFKKADPNDDLKKNIIDIENLVAASLDLQKDEHKQKKGWLSGLLGVGKSLAIGGLVGYLLTGKGEFVTKIRKGLIDGSVGVFKFLGKSVDVWYNEKGGKDVITNVGSFIGMSLIGAVKSVFLNPTFLKDAFTIGKILSGVKKAFSIGGIIKGLSSATKVINSGFSFASSLSRIISKSGFKAGGSLVLKSLIGKGGKFALKKLPVVGTLLSIMSAISRFNKGDKVGGMLDLASSVAVLFPGIGTGLSLAIDALNLFRDVKGDNYKVNQNSGFNKKMDKGNKSGFFNMYNKIGENVGLNSDDVNKDGDNFINSPPLVHMKKDWLFKNKFVNKIGKPDKDKGYTMPEKLSFFEKTMRALKGYKGISLYEQPNLFGLKPEMFNNFVNMAGEYYDLTGKNIQVNSAKRDRGGKSVHDFGYAVDIQSVNAEELEKFGLMEKYGFHRPLLHWGNYPGGKNEAWHVEPFPGRDVYGDRNTINNDFRVGTLMGKKPQSVKAEQGGGGFNLPLGKVDAKVKSNQTLVVSLTASDINRLAEAFGEQMKRNKPNFGSMSAKQQYVNPRAL